MKLKDETGIAFPLVLIVVLVLTMLGATLYMFSTAETRQVLLDENKVKAHYVARSGAHAVASHIIANPEVVDDLIRISHQNESPGEYEFGEGKYYVEVVDDESFDGEIRHRVVSRGVVNNVSQTIEVTVVNQGIECAVYANAFDISGGGNAIISNADVIFGGGDENSLDYDDTIEGMLEEGREVRFEHIEFDPVILPCEDPELDFGGCEAWESEGNLSGTNTITENKRYGVIDGTLVIDPDGEDLLLKADEISGEIHVKLKNNNTVAIVVDTLEVEAQGGGPPPRIGIELENVDDNDKGGFLLIYLNNYNSSGNSSVKADENCYLNVYVMEGGTMDLRGTPNFHGAIYAPDAASVMRGTCQIVGWVITDLFEIDGGGIGGIEFHPVKMRETSINFDFYRIEKWRYFD